MSPSCGHSTSLHVSQGESVIDHMCHHVFLSYLSVHAVVHMFSFSPKVVYYFHPCWYMMIIIMIMIMMMMMMVVMVMVMVMVVMMMTTMMKMMLMMMISSSIVTILWLFIIMLLLMMMTTTAMRTTTLLQVIITYNHHCVRVCFQPALCAVFPHRIDGSKKTAAVDESWGSLKVPRLWAAIAWG